MYAGNNAYERPADASQINQYSQQPFVGTLEYSTEVSNNQESSSHFFDHKKIIVVFDKFC